MLLETKILDAGQKLSIMRNLKEKKKVKTNGYILIW